MIRRRGARRLTGLLAVLVAVVVVVLGGAAPASAHATLISTDPAEGAVLPAAPEQVRFSFDEGVATAPDGAQVFDAAGGPVAASSTSEGSDLVVTLEEEVEPGTLVVVWRVVSSDGHPISGSLSFSVGAPSDTVAQPAAASAEVPAAPLLLSAARWIGYTGLLLAGGLVAFALLVAPRGEPGDQARARLRPVARLAALAAVVAWLAALPMVAAYQLGGGLAALTRGSTWSTLALSEYAVSLTVAVGLGVALVLAPRHPASRPATVVALVAAGAAVCAPALTGHTRGAAPQALTVAADVLHLLAGSVWLGGLVALALVLPGLADRGSEGAEVLARFSALAAGLLAALVVAGTLLGWRIVGSWSALVETGYGRLLLVKVLAALVAIAIAGWNRYRLVPALTGASRRRDRRTGAAGVVRAVSVEGAVIGVVLLLTGLLVDRSPQAEASVAAEVASAQVEGALGAEVSVEATVSPVVPGQNTVVIEMQDAAGQPVEGVEPPRLRLSSGTVDLGEVVVTNIGPGSYTAEALLPSVGTWQLQVSLRTGEFENPVSTLDFEVAAPGGATSATSTQP